MLDNFEEIVIDIPEDLYEKLKTAGKECGMTPEEYANYILEQGYKSGEFEKLIREEINKK